VLITTRYAGGPDFWELSLQEKGVHLAINAVIASIMTGVALTSKGQ
jgi:hypothetical protein